MIARAEGAGSPAPEAATLRSPASAMACPMNRILAFAIALSAATASHAAAAAFTRLPAAAPRDSAFLDQYAATYHFRLGEPTSITVTPEGDAVLFLRSGARSFVQDLCEWDARTRRERVLLTAERILRGAQEHLTAEERARRERMRVASRGIVSYQLSEDGRRILVPVAGRLFVIERASGATRELIGAPGFPIDPQFSPDGASVACVRHGDLYVFDLGSGRERRLTSGANDTLTHGLAEFVAQEEMGRFSGYWWSPDSRSIAYQETNTGPVETLHILDPAHPEQTPQSWRYPRPGRANAEVRLGIVPASGGGTTWVRWDRSRYPYLATVRWSLNAPLAILVQNRRQTEEMLLAVDVKDGAARPLLIERDPAWINLDQKMPHWLEDGGGFLWTTERAGRLQLELRARDGHLLRSLTRVTFPLRGFIHLDAEAQTAWVSGAEDPTQVQLWRVRLDGAGAPQPVTSEPGIHDGVFARHAAIWVHSFEGPQSGPRKVILDRDGHEIATLQSASEEPLLTTHLTFLTVGPRRERAVIVSPESFRRGERYPVIVSVYGGPHVNQVRQAARGYLLEQWIANRGFLVVSIDGRGTPGRGRSWERAIKNDLIQVPLEDQIEGLRAMAAEHPEMDLSRVGIYGWSFGGYFSAMAVMRRPDVFRAGVAGAPVVDWHDYDTHYTERYLDLPERDPRGYEQSSVLTYAGRLARPLLLVHGTVDDNVYFLHSMKLSEALFRAGKPFEFLPLAGFTHMVPDPLVTRRLYGRIASFLEEHVASAWPNAP